MEIAEENQPLKVAPLISDHKFDEFKFKIWITLLGLPNPILSYHLIFYFLLACIVIIPPIFIPQELYLLAVLLPVGLLPLIVFLINLIGSQQKLISRYIILGLYGFLWGNHFFMIKQNVEVIVISAITVLTSLSTVGLKPVQQFSSTSPYFSDPGVDSTLYIRFYIGIPALLAEVVIQLTGTFSFVYLYQLQLCTGLLFIAWAFGWVSSLKNTFLFLLTTINHIIFADEKNVEFIPSFISLTLNIGVIGAHMAFQSSKPQISYLIGMSTLTSFIVIFSLGVFKKRVYPDDNKMRVIASVLIEAVICGGLIGITFVDFSSINTSVFLGIDLAFYALFLIFKEIRRARSKLGCLLSCSFQKQWLLQLIQRYILRITSALTFVSLYPTLIETDFSNFIRWEQSTIQYLLLPILLYRSFKHSLSQPRAFSIHLALLLYLILKYTKFGSEGIIIAYIMPPFPHNFLRILTTPFFIPEKLIHSNECCYRFFYILISGFQLVLYIITFGIFQFEMIFGLPIFWCVIPTHTLGTDNRTHEQSLYEKIIMELQPSLWRGKKIGFYLLRMGKYIILLQIVSEGYGCFEIIDYKGLQVQEVTTCHAKEGETIDNCAEETWGENATCCSLKYHMTTIWPLEKRSVYTSGQNEIKLTGIIQSEEFFNLFKESLVKAIVYYYSKQYKDEKIPTCDQIHSQFSPLMSKQKAQSIFPSQFGKGLGIRGQYPLSVNGRKKLPPINQKHQKQKVLDDFLDLLGDQSSHQINPQQKQKQKQKQKEKQKQKQKQKEEGNEGTQTNIAIKDEQIHMSVILTIFHYIIGKVNYLNQQKLYKILKKDPEAIPQLTFPGKLPFTSNAVGSALKISIEKFTQGETDITIDDFIAYQSNEYLGTVGSEEFANALKQNKEQIWSIHYSKKTLTVKRLSKIQTDMYIFQVDAAILKSIWNNLRFELLYAANDDDERYSIQTHPYLLRNLFIEACEEPFGYPGYHSGLLMNQ